MRNSGPIRILHLSDFHFREGQEWDSDPVISGVKHAVADLVSSDLKPDVVAITGDVAYAGKEEDYSLARRWIEEDLLKALGNFDTRNLLIIPGNHDVDRAAVSHATLLLQNDILTSRNQEHIAAILKLDLYCNDLGPSSCSLTTAVGTGST